MTHISFSKGIAAGVAAFALSLAIVCAGMFAFVAPAHADDEYFMQFGYRLLDYDGSIYAFPGEKMVLSPTVTNMNSGKAVKGATFEWACDEALKAKTTDAKATISKLPGVGKYKVTITAFNAKGKQLCKKKVKIVVKKKLKTSIKLLVKGKSATSVKKGATMMLVLDNVGWGWCKNYKKRFYTISVKSLKTGKIATKSNTKALTKNSFVEQPTAIGGFDYPSIYGHFKVKGKYKVTGTVYRDGKKIASASKTITVK